MPLPDDPSINKLGDELVDTMRKTFDTPNNYRPVHAKGQLVKGHFVPNPAARYLSKASIFTKASTEVICRFSTDTGLPHFADNDENGSRGFATRFLLSEDGHQHFDIITNNALGFIVGTGPEFLEQFKAIKANKMDEFLSTRPHAKYFQENQAPAHSVSFANEQWYATHAYKFINAEGKERYFRWRFVPWQGVVRYSTAEAKQQSKNYQFDDLEWRLRNGKPIKYRLLAQLAEPNDPTNDSTKVWPETNEFVEMGEVVIDRLWTFDEGEPAGRQQKRIIYDPMPRYIEGIEASDDPLITVRTSVYLKSGQIRRHADDVESKPEDYKQ